MTSSKKRPKLATVGIAIVEIVFIIFLFYANLFMGEFTRTSGHNKTVWHALLNIFTMKTFGIALVAASIGFVVFDSLRKRV